MSYSHMGTPTLPSAQLRFTSEFGMESGGTTTLLSLDKKVTILKADINHTNLYSYVLLLCQSYSQPKYLGVVWLSLTGN